LMVPLRFFPASSMEYAKNQEFKLERARKKWEGSSDFPGEREDRHFKLCFGRSDPLDANFERVSRTLLEPLLKHMVKEPL